MCGECLNWLHLLSDAGRHQKRSERLPWAIAAAVILLLWAVAGTVVAVAPHTGDDLRVATSQARTQGFDEGMASVQGLLSAAQASTQQWMQVVDCIKVEVQAPNPIDAPHIPELIDGIVADCQDVYLRP